MKFQKKVIEELDHCYAVEVMEAEGRPYAFFAAENQGPCFAIDCETLTDRRQIWTEPGGTMSMAKIPGKKGEFLAVQRFFRLYDWEDACLVWVKPTATGYETSELFTLPYLHRFDLLQRGNKIWLIVCTLAAHKKTLEDWSCPGSVYVAELPPDWDGKINLKKLRGGFYQNHGYTRLRRDGYEEGLITCQQGIYIFTPPCAGSDEWGIRQIMPQATSDAALIDLDGDGEEEIAAIEQFHGCYFRIYKKLAGEWKLVFQHPEITEFYHVVKSGMLCGKPAFIGGCRRGRQQLFAITWDKKTDKPLVHTIDENVGPSNAVIFNGTRGDMIFSANREAGQAAVYFARDPKG